MQISDQNCSMCRTPNKTRKIQCTGKVLASSLMMLMMFCRSSSNFAQDKKVCQQQLVNLSSCLNFVTGDAKAPSPACCTELHQDIDKSKFCLCVLVRDRIEPSLGFKLNATRALSLNPLCKTNSNATICPELLHLSLNSPEAQIFEQFGNSTHAGDTLPSSATKLSVKLIRQAAIIAFLV
ncbi:non-specific lipid transfer protein GPI-anchored 22-like isoform X2 [Salvia hispanica]|uniref:non-specific lipid transfer protein GPI-anchored 22-like isoform X2 n=1 Tax=Salvia hispanica TaxID=49212 RepID=UPI00200907DA|nr:non-specific lipid transfer protein GPI-anchored 22-like isoform X2 [Salvia hispanica]